MRVEVGTYTVTETVNLDNQRLIDLVGDPGFDTLMTPATAEQLGLALIRMAEVARLKDEYPEHFGESTTSKIQTREVGKKDRRQASMRDNFGAPGRRTSDARKRKS